MKAFLLLALAGAALASPQRGGRGQGRRPAKAKKSESSDPMNIVRCMAENFGNNQTIQDCVDCFKEEMDFSQQSGLDAAKACATKYWPQGVAECSSQISAMTAGNMESLETVVECFDDRLERENAERCIGEATSTDTQAKMTEATMCILDSWKYAFKVVKSMNGPKRRRGGRRQGRRGGRGKGKYNAGKKMMMKVMMEAHCDVASGDDATKSAACQQCFKDAMPAAKLSQRPRGGRGRRRGRRAADPETLAAITACSRAHLSPAYDQCTAMMEAGEDKKATHKCFNKVLLGEVVSECVTEEGVDTVTPDTLDQVMECGMENIFEWLQEKNPKAAEKLGDFLKKMGMEEE